MRTIARRRYYTARIIGIAELDKGHFDRGVNSLHNVPAIEQAVEDCQSLLVGTHGIMMRLVSVTTEIFALGNGLYVLIGVLCEPIDRERHGYLGIKEQVKVESA